MMPAVVGVIAGVLKLLAAVVNLMETLISH